MDSLPMNGTGETTMRVWQIAFLQNFGTHIALKSSHGAMIQGTASADASCKMSSSCRNFEGCLKMGFLKYVDFKLCAESEDCKRSESCESTFQTACAAIGGDTSLNAPTLCNSDNEADIDRFLSGGNMSSSDSKIGLTFRSIGEILIQMGFWQVGLHVMKADEFYTCDAPQGAWLPTGDDHECKCVLECKNGGSLDPNSCTCTCRGNDDHGFTGGDCSGDFGKCVRGVGSSGTPTARGRACVEGNICGGIERSDHCGNTDVCCNRDEGGLCCPWGNTCSCWAHGRFCQCKPR